MATAAAGVREALAVAEARQVIEGAGVPIRRALPSRQAPYELVDPFLLLDEGHLILTPGAPGFPPHPHRGFEIVTYSLRGPISQVMTAEGKEVPAAVSTGGLLRITAGRGMTHGEGTGGLARPGDELHILQLWINLARADKQVEPSAQAVPPESIPLRSWGRATVRTLVGEGAPTRLRTPALYLDVDLPAGERLDLPVPEGWQGFAYLIAGEGTFGGNARPATAGQLVVLGPGSTFPAEAGREGLRFVLAAGQPHREEPRWHGSFVD